MGRTVKFKVYNEFMKKAKTPSYENKLKTIKADFFLSDAQYDIVYRQLVHIFCMPTIRLYIDGHKFDHIKKNVEKANMIYLTAKDFIDNNRILLNKEIKD